MLLKLLKNKQKIKRFNYLPKLKEHLKKKLIKLILLEIYYSQKSIKIKDQVLKAAGSLFKDEQDCAKPLKI